MEVTFYIPTKRHSVVLPNITCAPNSSNFVVNNCASVAGREQSGVGPSACEITTRAVILSPTGLRQHGPDGEYDAPTSSRQLQSPWLPVCLTEDGQQPDRYGYSL